METNTTETPVCPDPHLYAYTVYRTDRRTKTGWRVLEEYEMQFQDEQDAEQHARYVSATGCRVEYRKYWVLKRNFMASQPGFPQHYWEAWNTPYCCSPASELYWTM
jgi:hypothetical protein